MDRRQENKYEVLPEIILSSKGTICNLGINDQQDIDIVPKEENSMVQRTDSTLQMEATDISTTLEKEASTQVVYKNENLDTQNTLNGETSAPQGTCNILKKEGLDINIRVDEDNFTQHDAEKTLERKIFTTKDSFSNTLQVETTNICDTLNEETPEMSSTLYENTSATQHVYHTLDRENSIPCDLNHILDKETATTEEVYDHLQREIPYIYHTLGNDMKQVAYCTLKREIRDETTLDENSSTAQDTYNILEGKTLDDYHSLDSKRKETYNTLHGVSLGTNCNLSDAVAVYEELSGTKYDTSKKDVSCVQAFKMKWKFVAIVLAALLVFIMVLVRLVMTGMILRDSNKHNSKVANSSIATEETVDDTPYYTPVKSCSSLPPNSSTGYYWVMSSNGSAIRVYCDMNKTCESITGGWMKVISLDMSKTSSKCPTILCPHEDPMTCRTCERGCTSVIFTVGATFSKVCGRIIAYQIRATNAYSPKLTNSYDGIRLMYGNPEIHIWTFYAAQQEKYKDPLNACPCINPQIPQPPKFVGNHYFCDTAPLNYKYPGEFYHDDPLWDGAGCEWANQCCSYNNPPWFYRDLQNPSNNDIIMKICLDECKRNEDIAIEKIDIYVQ